MIRSVVIEIRPGLGTCSVCIFLKDSLEADVKVRKSMILLKIEDEEFTITFNDFEVEPLTMTCLSIQKGRVNFRIGIISCIRVEKTCFKRIPPVQPNHVTRLYCKCGCPITEDVTFARALPLPNHDVDLSDMFCHYHDNMKMSIAPKVGDFLYGVHFISVNRELLKNVRTNLFIKCRRCLASIGLSRKDMVRIWNVCINLPYENLTPVEEFKRILRNAVQESMVIFLKIFLECVENGNGLLISVMDKDLLLSRAEEDLKLKTCQILKIKYEYYKSYNDNVKKFLEKENALFIEIPSVVLNAGFDFLLKSSQEIPPTFRVIEDELMAYLEI